HRCVVNVLGAFQCRGFFLDSDLGQIIRNGGADRIGAGPNGAVVGQASAFTPATQNILRLPEVEYGDVIGRGGVVGDTDRSGFVLTGAEVAAADPGACAVAAVIAEPQPFRDFDKVGRAARGELGAG